MISFKVLTNPSSNILNEVNVKFIHFTLSTIKSNLFHSLRSIQE